MSITPASRFRPLITLWAICLTMLWVTAGYTQDRALIDSLNRVIASDVADSTKVIALGEVAWELRIHDKEKALEFARKELSLAEKIGFSKGIGLGHMDLGTTYGYHGDYLTAIDHYQEALNWFRLAGKPKLEAMMYYNTAIAYMRFEASEKAIEHFLQALPLLERQHDWTHVSQTYTGIANSYATLKLFDTAIKYHQKALEIARTHEDWEVLAIGYADFSSTYNAMHDAVKQTQYLDSSSSYLYKAYDLIRDGKVQNPIMLPTVTHNIGNNYFQSGNYEEAERYIVESIAYATPLNIAGVHCMGNTILGKIYTKRKQYAKAKHRFDSALPVAVKSNPQFAKDTYDALYEWAIAQDKYREAAAYQRQSGVLKDSIYNIEKAKIAEHLALQYETEKKEARIQSLEQENEFKKKRLELYAVMLILGAVIAVMSILLLKLKHRVLQHRMKLSEESREKARLQQEIAEQEQNNLQQELHMQAMLHALKEAQHRKELDFKERELTTNVVLREQSSAFLRSVKNELQLLMPKSNGVEEGVKKIYKLVDRQLSNEQEFGTFLIHFEKVHPGFFKRLSAHATVALSLADQKLSAYIRMKLSTKEVAQLLNVEPKSIQMARYRLKQKLRLGEETDLQQFIQSL